MIDNAYKIHRDTKLPEFQLDVIANSNRDALIPDDVYVTYGLALKEYCSNSIEDNIWTIPFADGIRHATVSFESLDASADELRLVKAYIVDTLSVYSSPSTCVSKIKSLSFLLRFLHEKGYRITMLSTAVLNLYHLWLDEESALQAEKKNLIEADLKGFIEFLREHHLVRPGIIALPVPREVKRGEVKRAPDKQILSLLDSYFFDFSIKIPCTYRCLYVLLRLIPARNQEVLSMKIDDFSADGELMEIRIPTYKETANHRPVYQSHYRLAGEYPEQLLLKCLQEQREFAMEQQHNITEPALKNRLMLSPKDPARLVKPNEFNSFLKETCEVLGIMDVYGDFAYVTMYSLRHANGAAMAFSSEISSQEFSRAFAHNSRFSDDSYGYASKHDELQNTSPFTQSVRNALSPQTGSDVSQHISCARLKKLQRECDTQLIGSKAVCGQKNCAPQLSHCVLCQSFKPDPQYMPEAEYCCEVLKQRIERCKSAGNDVDVEFNERLLALYTTFIRRVETE